MLVVLPILYFHDTQWLLPFAVGPQFALLGFTISSGILSAAYEPSFAVRKGLPSSCVATQHCTIYITCVSRRKSHHGSVYYS